MAKESEKTKERIFNAAYRLFAEHGYENVSIRAIADMAETKLGSIYYHFESKELLYFEVFVGAYDLTNALTYDVLLEREPQVLDTPEGKSYAIQRVVFDYFQRHIFTPEPWRRKFILRELFLQTPIFFRLVEEILDSESQKMLQFYHVLRPDGSKAEAHYWSHLPDTQGLYYLMSSSAIEKYQSQEFMTDLSQTIVKSTAKLMISMLDLPIPAMLE